MKTIYVNGQQKQTESENLHQLLIELEFDVTAIATAIDGNFVPKSLYQTTAIQQGQKIEVLAPMQGG